MTGCLAERYQQEMAKEIPEADVILGIGSNDEICDAIEKALAGEKVRRFGRKKRSRWRETALFPICRFSLT